MIDNRQSVEMIEQAHTQNPFCSCGAPTIAVGRAGGVWLECRSLQERPMGIVSRLVAAFAIHTRELIVDLSPTLMLAHD